MLRRNIRRDHGRHRHTVTVRDDGLGAVLGRLRHDRSVAVVLLAEVASGMVLAAHRLPQADADAAGLGEAEIEELGARCAELARTGEPHALSAAGPRGVGLLRVIPDRHGDLVLAATLRDGRHARSWRRRRILRRLHRVPAAALTAGPTTHLRPTSTADSIAWIPRWTQPATEADPGTPNSRSALGTKRILPVLPAPHPPGQP